MDFFAWLSLPLPYQATYRNRNGRDLKYLNKSVTVGHGTLLQLMCHGSVFQYRSIFGVMPLQFCGGPCLPVRKHGNTTTHVNVLARLIIIISACSVVFILLLISLVVNLQRLLFDPPVHSSISLPLQCSTAALTFTYHGWSCNRI